MSRCVIVLCILCGLRFVIMMIVFLCLVGDCVVVSCLLK